MATSQAFRNALHIPNTTPPSAGMVATADTATDLYASSWQLGAAAGAGAPWYTGHGAPDGATGIQGGYYIDLDSDTIYGPKAASVPYWSVAMQMTGPELLAKLLPVDGAGTGLDADLLDGANSTAYLDLANHTGNLDAGTF